MKKLFVTRDKKTQIKRLLSVYAFLLPLNAFYTTDGEENGVKTLSHFFLYAVIFIEQFMNIWIILKSK